MTVGKAIFDLLLGNTDLRAIVNNRIFPEVAQQDAELPYVVYNISSNEPSDTKREPSKMDTAQVEVNLYSTSYTECIDMATHVRAALDRVTGTYSGVNVQSIQYLGEVIDFDEAQRAYNITSDYDVRVSRSDFEIAQGSPITGVTLGELSDVDTTGVTDGQVIAYDAAAQEWQPADDAGGVTQLGQLTDVQFGQGGPESGDLLKYDGSEWTNDGLVKSEIGLGNVDNTSDASKPVSTATQTELNAKANSADFSNVDNTSDADKPVSTATQTALNAKADTSAVPTDLNDLSDVSIVGTPAGNQALIYDATAGAFKSQVSYTNRFEDEVEQGLYIPTIYAERGYSVKSEGDGIFIDASSDTPTAGKVIKRKIYHKSGFISDNDVIGDYTLIHTFADDTAYADTVAVFDAFEEGATYGVPPFTLFQTWEEVTAAPAFTGLLNETYGSGAEAAYSTRRLNGNVTECMVIRRASDSTTTTIGFDGSGNISEADIETFCTGTTCTVSEWKDQSGNGKDATTTGTEPIIYTGGAIVKNEGKVAIDFDTAYSALKYTGQDLNLSAVTATMVGREINQGGSQGWGIVMQSDNNDGFRTHYQSSSVRNRTAGTNLDLNITDSSLLRQRFLHDIASSTSLSKSTFNGVASATGGGKTFSTNGLDLAIGGSSYSAVEFRGNMNEAILFGVDKYTSGDIASIRENIGDYFTQNTPLLDTYSGAAAAYSLRRLSSTYTGDAVEVYNTVSYADIGFNVFGELDTVALAAHCGSNDGFVSKWYSQTGSNDAVQTTTANMPKIYDGTTGVVTENGKPAVQFDGSDDVLNGSSINPTNDLTMLVVYNCSSSNQFNTLFGQGRGFIGSGEGNTDFSYGLNQNNVQPDVQNTNQTGVIGLSASTSRNKQELGELYYSRNANAYVYVDGSLGDSATTPDYPIRNAHSLSIGAAGFTPNARIQEAIVYNSDQNAAGNRAGIETNINTFYNIYS